MTYAIFLAGLLASSTLTSLITEAIKKLFDESEKTYKANALAGIVAIVVSLVLAIGYAVITNTAFSGQMAVIVIALMVLSWLCAMLGYDKVIQAISQFKIGDDS